MDEVSVNMFCMFYLQPMTYQAFLKIAQSLQPTIVVVGSYRMNSFHCTHFPNNIDLCLFVLIWRIFMENTCPNISRIIHEWWETWTGLTYNMWYVWLNAINVCNCSPTQPFVNLPKRIILQLNLDAKLFINSHWKFDFLPWLWMPRRRNWSNSIQLKSFCEYDLWFQKFPINEIMRPKSNLFESTSHEFFSVPVFPTQFTLRDDSWRFGFVSFWFDSWYVEEFKSISFELRIRECLVDGWLEGWVEWKDLIIWAWDSISICGNVCVSSHQPLLCVCLREYGVNGKCMLISFE